jgi:hypothetical protein
MHESFWCEACERYVAPDAIVQLGPAEGKTRVPSCPHCRRHVRRERHESSRPLFEVLSRGAIWPLERQAASILLAFGLAVWFLFRYASLFGLGPLIASAALLVQAAAIVRSTGEGSDAMPATAEILGWDDVAATLIRYALVLVVGAVPTIAVEVYTAEWNEVLRGLLRIGALSIGALYVPAALIRAAGSRGLLAVLEPWTPIRIAVRIGIPYFACALATWLTAVVWLLALMIVWVVTGYLGFVPILPGVLVAATASAGFFAVARVLGLAVREHRHDLGLS